jgi:hypothetical protein
MRAFADKWGEFVTRVEITMELEEVFHREISDAEVQDVRTLHDFVRVIREDLPPGPDRERRALDLIRAAAKKVDWCSVNDVQVDVALMDAVDPERWTRKESQ